MEDAYTKTPSEVLKAFGVAEEKGLSAQQVQSLRQKHGRNGTWDQGWLRIYLC
jgi:Ca2+ transporting ATPase